MCVYICVWGVVLTNILASQLDLPKQEFLTPPLPHAIMTVSEAHVDNYKVISVKVQEDKYKVKVVSVKMRKINTKS